MDEAGESKLQTFWDHLDELRVSLMRILMLSVALGIAAFVFKDALFNVILAPKHDSFITYQLFRKVSDWLALPGALPDSFSIELINTQLADQFVIHMKVAMFAGLLCASPYTLYLLFKFIAPALYLNERKYAVRMVGGGYVMFLMGVLLNYLLIFPLTVRFLGTYQVSPEVKNLISLQSYVDMLVMLSLMMGIVFEIPILCWLLAKFGFLSDGFMRKYRRHAFVTIVIIAAIITPTSDAFTLTLVALPMYLLYEISILIVKHSIHKS